MLASLIASLRAARKIGAADHNLKLGDYSTAMKRFGEALMVLESTSVDLDSAGCRAASSTALYGYCWTAAKLGDKKEVVQMLHHWRSRYLGWIEAPLTKYESEYLKWFENYLASTDKVSPK